MRGNPLLLAAFGLSGFPKAGEEHAEMTAWLSLASRQNQGQRRPGILARMTGSGGIRMPPYRFDNIAGATSRILRSVKRRSLPVQLMGVEVTGLGYLVFLS